MSKSEYEGEITVLKALTSLELVYFAEGGALDGERLESWKNSISDSWESGYFNRVAICDTMGCSRRNDDGEWEDVCF